MSKIAPLVSRFRFALIFVLGVQLAVGLLPVRAAVGEPTTASAEVAEAMRVKVERDGWLRVRVDLNPALILEVSGDHALMSAGNDEMQRTVDDLLFEMPLGSYNNVQQEAGGSTLNLSVDAAGLDTLLDSPWVAAVAETTLPAMQPIAAGKLHSLAIKPDGTLWVWGDNRFGQLGDGTLIRRVSPLSTLSQVAGVATGLDHTLAFKNDGSLWAWGLNTYGQLGDGSTTTRTTPVEILEDVAGMAAGLEHTLAFQKDGTLWAWGRNYYGQLGDGSKTTRLRPVKVLEDVKAVTAGWLHSLALKNDGTLWAWGTNRYSQLGDGTTLTRLRPFKVMEGVAAVTAGRGYTLALKTDGTLWSWGNNPYGQLGDGTKGVIRAVPYKVLSAVASVTTGAYHTLATTTDGKLYAWGRNKNGQIGNGTVIDQLTPVQVMEGVAGAQGGASHTLAMKTDGSLWAWGANFSGQIGDGSTTGRRAPVRVLGFGSLPAAPTGLVATGVSTSAIRLIWQDNSTDESGFRIERRQGDGAWSEIAVVRAGVTSYANKNLPIATEYSYRVRAFSAAGTSDYSSEATATTLGGIVPAAPTALTATSVSDSQIDLTWQDNSTDESGFRIERKRAVATDAWAAIATVGPNVTSYSDVGLTGLTAYRYRIRAFNANGNSAYSTIASAKTQ